MFKVCQWSERLRVLRLDDRAASQALERGLGKIARAIRERLVLVTRDDVIRTYPVTVQW